MIQIQQDEVGRLQGGEVNFEAGGLCFLFRLDNDMATGPAPPRLFDPQMYPLWLEALC